MAGRGWVLLVVCLLMQAAPLHASSCQIGVVTPSPNPSPHAGECAAAACCCGALDEVGGRSGCECTESPAPDSPPAPFVPRPTTGDRDALTAPEWVDVKQLGARPLGRLRAAPPMPTRRLLELATAVKVPLTVRFQVFLI
ncbi:MAG: hypothetical protein ACKV19_04865 [Verrucomicrobiales bacterium]